MDRFPSQCMKECQELDAKLDATKRKRMEVIATKCRKAQKIELERYASIKLYDTEINNAKSRLIEAKKQLAVAEEQIAEAEKKKKLLFKKFAEEDEKVKDEANNA